MLAYARAARLPLSEYGEEFVSAQYDAALAEGNPRDAHSIAGTMLYEGDRIVKDRTRETALVWQEREKSAFEQHAKAVLAREILPGDSKGLIEFQAIFNGMRRREDEFGFGSATQSDLVRRFVEKNAAIELSRGQGNFAIEDAIEAKMPEDFIKTLRDRIAQQDRANNPKLIDKVGNIIRKIKGKKTNFK